MSRSIEVLPYATASVYFEWHCGYCPECNLLTDSHSYTCEECGSDLELSDWEIWQYEQLLSEIRETIMYEFPEYDRCEIPQGRETLAILTSPYGYVTATYYCGIVCLSVIPHIEVGGGANSGAEMLEYLEARQWCDENIIPYLKRTYGSLIPLSVMSNGETIYQRMGELQ